MTPDEAAVREAICERILLVWESSGMTRANFARLIGVTPQAISNYASYTRMPTHATIYRTCERFRVSPSIFYPRIKSLEALGRSRPVERAWRD
jgi:transcriptional regulator with XRE-family HTH domain